MYLIRFCFADGSAVPVMAREGENLLKIAKRAGIPIWAPCSGSASCGKCRVRILRGKLQSTPTIYISDVEYSEGWRLACSSKVCGDADVLVG